jgi:PAS domain S-box-containing protein
LFRAAGQKMIKCDKPKCRPSANGLQFLALLLVLFALRTPALWGGADPAIMPGRIVTSYRLTSSHDPNGHDPQAWRLLASNDGGDAWTVLDVRTNQSFGGHPEERAFRIPNRMAYHIYRLQIDEPHFTNDASAQNVDASIQLSGLDLIGQAVGVTNEADLQSIVTASQAHPVIGRAENAFDGDPSTRWVDYGLTRPGYCWIQCEYTLRSDLAVTNVSQLRIFTRLAATGDPFQGQQAEVVSYLTTHTPITRTLSGYALTSANDEPERDPRDWRLLGSTDGGKTWKTLDARSNELFTTRLQRRVFVLTNAPACSLYRFCIDSVRVPSAASCVQLADFEPLYPGGKETGKYSLGIRAQNDNPPLESVEAAFDGDAKTKWLDFARANPARSSWLQWQYFPWMENLPLVNLDQVDPILNANLYSNVVAQVGKSSRTLTAYALTSANDAPERNPRDWRLLGSTNGGATWQVLDERKNQLFPKPFARRVFTLARPAAFPAYRLEIDAIAASANSVQLAEIEPIYASNDPQSLLSLAVTSHGENTATHETADKAFDHNNDTKWLDFIRGTADSQTHLSEPHWIQWQYVAGQNNPVIDLDQIRPSPTPAPRPLQLQMEGVAVGCGSNKIGFLDDTGFQWIGLPGLASPDRIGRRLQISGRLQFMGGNPSLARPQVVDLGALLSPDLIYPGELLPQDRHFVSSTVQGRVTSVSGGNMASTVELQDEQSDACLTVKILDPGDRHLLFPLDLCLSAHGVVERVFNDNGQPVAGVLWVPDYNGVELLPTDSDWQRFPECSIAALTASNGPVPGLVRIRGEVSQIISSNHLIIRQGAAELAAFSSSPLAAQTNAAVELAGFFDLDNGRPALRLACARPAPAEMPLAGDGTVPLMDDDHPLTEMGQIRELGAAQPGRIFPIKVRGVITYIDLGLGEWYLQDGQESLEVGSQLNAGLSPFVQQEGSCVELTGVFQGNFAYAKGFVSFLGKGRMPAPLRHAWDYLMTGKDDGKWVEIEGVVTAAEEHRLTLAAAGGSLIVWVNDLDNKAQEGLLGARIRARGVCAGISNNHNQRLGLRLLVPSSQYLGIISAAPSDPFALPLTPISSIMGLDATDINLGAHLVKTAGVVTYKEPRLIFVQDGGVGVRAIPRADVSVEPGDRVEVVGLAQPDGLSPKLVQALVRLTGHASLPVPQMMDLDAISMDSSTNDATRRQVEAVFLGARPGEADRLLELQDQATGQKFLARLPPGDQAMPRILSGSRVRLTGVVKAITDPVADIGLVTSSFEIYLNSPADIVILQRPPWWTSAHATRVLGGLAGVLLLALTWVVSLRRQVGARTRELSAEITERQAAEEAMRSSEMLFHSIWDRSLDSMILTDEGGKLVTVNAAFCELVGMKPGQLAGRPFHIIYGACEDSEKLMRGYETAFANRANRRQEELCRTLWNGKSLILEHSTAYVDVPGRPGLMLGLFRDVTAQRLLQAQLRQSQKMESIGQLAGGVAHDFNNILTLIYGHASLLVSSDLPCASKDSAEEIYRAAQRAASLTRQLLTFGRRQIMQVRVVDLNEVVREMTKMLGRLLGEAYNLELNFCPEPLLIPADVGMIEQVVLNLALNSRDAMPRGGHLVIRTAIQDFDTALIARNPEARPGRFVCLSVADNGCGVSPQDIPRLFEPFFTTKEVGKGTGLGLATVYGIAKQHKGWVEVESEPGNGATFKVYLPADGNPSSAGSPNASATATIAA